MKIGDLVYICPGDITVGIFIGPDDEESHQFLESVLEKEVHHLHRSQVLFDDDIYSVPTFQLEVVDESR